MMAMMTPQQALQILQECVELGTGLPYNMRTINPALMVLTQAVQEMPARQAELDQMSALLAEAGISVTPPGEQPPDGAVPIGNRATRRRAGKQIAKAATTKPPAAADAEE